ncbi:MAG: hypothetical protein V3U68_02690 [Bacteroidota bacterium]
MKGDIQKGSILVFDFFTAEGEDVAYVVRARKLVSVMEKSEKNSMKREAGVGNRSREIQSAVQ